MKIPTSMRWVQVPCRRLLFAALVLIMLASVVQAARAAQPQQEQVGAQATSGALQVTIMQGLAQPPALTPERRATLEAALERQARLRRSRPVGEQVPVTESPGGTLAEAPDVSAPQRQSPGNPFAVEVLSALAPNSALLPTAVVGEPSVAQTGGFVFYTGNWYAANAYTANPGPTDWNYIDPTADMADFCCDQDTVADRGRDMILWTRLGLNGRFVLGESTDHVTFCTWELNPAQLGLGGTYDQPLMALSNNYLYISAQIYGPFHSVLLRIALDTLQDCPGGFGYTWWDNTSSNGWGSLVQGATTTMYYGGHRGTNNSFWINSQPEANTSLFTTGPIAIPAFTFQNGNSNCPVAGTNPCGRSDSRAQTGWVRKGTGQTIGELGWMWDAHEGGFFPWPYVEADTFREDTFAQTGRPWIAYSNTGVEYPGVSPNARGDLGLTTTLMGGGFFPDVGFYLADDYEGMWSFQAYMGVSNCSGNAWGDYVRNRSFLPTQTGWSSAEFTCENNSIVPRLFIVSRKRDQPGIVRYLNAP